MLILVHELGHYISARIFGVEIKEFSIGMGPKIYSKVSEKNQIRYSIRLLPIGGYVAMVGEDEESEHENALCNKPVYQRIIITFAGSFMNLLLGVILTLCMTLSLHTLGSTTINSFADNSISNSYGLRAGDKIVEVNNSSTKTMSAMIYEIGHGGDKPMDITVIRDNKKVTVKDVKFGTENEEGITFGVVDFYVNSKAKSFSNVINDTVYNSILTVKMIAESLGDLVTGKFGLNAMSGPVGVTVTISNAAKEGITSFLYLCAMIAINLGVFNLLPLPALDGGRIVFQLIELATRKKVDAKIENLVHTIGIMLLLFLMLLITFKDVIKLL